MIDDERMRIMSALTSDHHSKAAYTGRIQQTETVTVITEDGTSIQKDVSFYITWDTIDKLLNLVKERAIA